MLDLVRQAERLADAAELERWPLVLDVEGYVAQAARDLEMEAGGAR